MKLCPEGKNEAPISAAPFHQVLDCKGLCKLRSSTSALHHTLQEAAALLAMFWRAALPSSHSPVLLGKAVRGQGPALAAPNPSSPTLLRPQVLCSCLVSWNRCPWRQTSSPCGCFHLPRSPALGPGRRNRREEGKDIEWPGSTAHLSIRVQVL